MRKRVLGAQTLDGPATTTGWLDLERIAQVELSSEDPAHPIEAALRDAPGEGWRAAEPGPQLIRIIFDQPQTLRRIALVFQEDGQERSQEFALSWSPDGGQSYREVLRQQYNFSPPLTRREVEEYQVELEHVTALVLRIDPDRGRGSAHASLAALRLA